MLHLPTKWNIHGHLLYLTCISSGALDKWRWWAPSSLLWSFVCICLFLVFFLLTLTHILCFSGNILNVYLVKSIGDGNIQLWSFVWTCLRKQFPHFRLVQLFVLATPNCTSSTVSSSVDQNAEAEDPLCYKWYATATNVNPHRFGSCQQRSAPRLCMGSTWCSA